MHEAKASHYVFQTHIGLSRLYWINVDLSNTYRRLYGESVLRTLVLAR